MSATQTLTTSFKVEILNGYHAFSSAYRAADAFKIALYTTSASLDATTTGYTTTGEAVGGSYVAGGQLLTALGPIPSGVTGCVCFNTVNWAGSIAASYALIYNSTQGNRSVCVLNFGGTKVSLINFSVAFPVNDQNNAVVRIQ